MDYNVFTPVELPCGRIVENRLVKAAMYEHMSSFFGGPPNDFHYGLYSEWAKHGWGMIITGNVQVSPQHLTLGRDIVIPAILDDLKPFERLAKVIHGGANHVCPLAIMQLSHAGRQSPNFIGGRPPFVPPLAPSPIRLGASHPGKGVIADMLFHTLFQVPKGMTTKDIFHVQSSFVRGALLAYKSGFDGIQLHAAHGYLLAQFMNPTVQLLCTFKTQLIFCQSNTRNDEYSAQENIPRLLFEIIKAIRKVVPTAFVIGIKINSTDYVASGGSEEIDQLRQQRILEHIHTIATWGIIDFIEISGGDYEKPDFLRTGGFQKSGRQAFFARFSQTVMSTLYQSSVSSSVPLILLTGGLCSPSHLQTALASGHADLLGIGRGAVLCPDLPQALRLKMQYGASPSTWVDNPFAHEPEAVLRASKWIPSVKLIGAGVGTAWYTIRMRDIAISQIENPNVEPPPIDYNRGGLTAIFKMWVWFGAVSSRVLWIFLALILASALCYHY